MTPDEYARVKEIFDQAVDVPDEKRDQLVRLCCGEDTLIRDEVMSLLRFHRLGTILATDTVDLPLAPARAVHFLIQVCGALEEALDAGFIHRDIKPANIFASQRGGI